MGYLQVIANLQDDFGPNVQMRYLWYHHTMMSCPAKELNFLAAAQQKFVRCTLIPCTGLQGTLRYLLGLKFGFKCVPTAHNNDDFSSSFLHPSSNHHNIMTTRSVPVPAGPNRRSGEARDDWSVQCSKKLPTQMDLRSRHCKVSHSQIQAEATQRSRTSPWTP